MSVFSRIVKNRRTQRAVAQSMEASADSIPESAPVSAKNSKGTSKTSAQLIPYLEQAFEDINPDVDLDTNFAAFRLRLGERVSQYSNAAFLSLPEYEWFPSDEVKSLLRIAAETSVNVYNPSSTVPVAGPLTFTLVKKLSASMGAVSKATKIFKVHQTDSTQQSTLLPVLVIAIRGTVKMSLDWSVNLRTETMFDQDIATFAGNESIQIHGGYLESARDLFAQIDKQICEVASSPLLKHVLFTGHSAGGAVASLLFLMVLIQAKLKYPNLCFSLVTFGAPPTTSQSLDQKVQALIKSQTNPGMALAIVNADDPVSRIDSSYVQSIIDLYDAGLLPTIGSSTIQSKPWHMAKPDLHSIGETIVLKDESLESESQAGIHAYCVPFATFSQLIFSDLKAHKKTCYLGRICLMEKQTFHPVLDGNEIRLKLVNNTEN